MMASAFDFSWMVGRAVKVSFCEPSMWTFVLGKSVGIHVECPWRLLEDGQIAVSNEDHLQKYGLPNPIDAAEVASSLLLDGAVQRVEVRKGTADLILDFDGNRRLEILPFSSGYESWQVITPDGKSVIAQGGGQLSTW